MMKPGSRHLILLHLQQPRIVDTSSGMLAAAQRCTVTLEHQFPRQLLPDRLNRLLCHHGWNLAELKQNQRSASASLCYVVVTLTA